MSRLNVAGAGWQRVQMHPPPTDVFGAACAPFSAEAGARDLRLPLTDLLVTWGPASKNAVAGPWSQPDSRLLVLVPGATEALIADMSDGHVAMGAETVRVGENPHNLQSVVFKLSCPGCSPVHARGESEFDTILKEAKPQQCVATFAVPLHAFCSTGDQVVFCKPAENPLYQFAMRIRTRSSPDPYQAALLSSLTGDVRQPVAGGGSRVAMPGLTLDMIKAELSAFSEQRRAAILTHLQQVAGDAAAELCSMHMIECPMNSFFGLDTADPAQMDALNASLARHLRDRYGVTLCGAAQQVVVWARAQARVGESDYALVQRLYSTPEGRVDLKEAMRVGINHWVVSHFHYANDASLGACLLEPGDDATPRISPWLKTNGEAQNLAGLATVATKLHHDDVFSKFAARIAGAVESKQGKLHTEEGELTSLGLGLNLATAMPSCEILVGDCEDSASKTVAAERAAFFSTHEELMETACKTLGVIMPSQEDHHAIKAVLGAYRVAVSEARDPLCLALVYAHSGYIGAGGDSIVGAPDETVSAAYHTLETGRATERWAGHAVATAVAVNNVHAVTVAVPPGAVDGVAGDLQRGPGCELRSERARSENVLIGEVDRGALRFYEGTAITDVMDPATLATGACAAAPDGQPISGAYAPPMKTLHIKAGGCRRVSQIAEKFNELRVDQSVAQNVLNEVAATTMSEIYYGRSFVATNASDPAAGSSFYKFAMFAGPWFQVAHAEGLPGLLAAKQETADVRATKHVRAAIRDTTSASSDDVLEAMLKQALVQYLKEEKAMTLAPCASIILAKRPSDAHVAQPLGLCVPVGEREAMLLDAVACGVVNMFPTLDHILESARTSHLRLMPTASSSTPRFAGGSKITTCQPMTLLGSSMLTEAESIHREVAARHAVAQRAGAKGVIHTSSHAWGMVL